MAYGTLRNETKRNATLRNGTLRNGSLRNGTLRNGTLRNGTLRNGTLRNIGLERQTMRDDVVSRLLRVHIRNKHFTWVHNIFAIVFRCWLLALLCYA